MDKFNSPLTADPALGRYTRNEILSQPQVWRATFESLRAQQAALCDFFAAGGYSHIYFTGCGSTYYLALAAAAILQELAPVAARGLPASEIWLNPAAVVRSPDKPLLVAVSRSGETTETLRACSAFRSKHGGDVLTLSCYPGCALTDLGDLNLVFPEAQEESVAQTRAFTTLYLATVALAALWGDRDDLFAALPGLMPAAQRLLNTTTENVAVLGSDLALERFYFLGSAFRYGLACELSLKMKEMTLSHSEPFHFLEYRHGPKSMVTTQTLIVALLSEANRAQEIAVIDEMHAMGARTLTLGEDAGDIQFHSGLDESLRGPLYLPAVQMMAWSRSVAKGLNPDRPNNLDSVVVL
jgi:glucosamine--fructose-6-phosphate aminotransferase (isomerizing)